MPKDELIAALEKATKGSAELDALIRCAAYCPQGYVEQSPINGAWCVYDGTTERSGRPRLFVGEGRNLEFSRSIDAALTLVPEGCLAVFHLFNHRDNFWECDLGDTGPDYRGQAATPALAIVIAALRATERGEAGR